MKQCEQAARQLDNLRDMCKKYLIKISPPDSIDGFLTEIKRIKDDKQKAINLLLDDIMSEISQ